MFPSLSFIIYHISSQISIISLTIFLQEINIKSEARCFLLLQCFSSSFKICNNIPVIFLQNLLQKMKKSEAMMFSLCLPCFFHFLSKATSNLHRIFIHIPNDFSSRKKSKKERNEMFSFVSIQNSSKNASLFFHSSSSKSYHISSQIFIHIPNEFPSRKKFKKKRSDGFL